MWKACSTNGKKRKSYRILVGMAEGKRLLRTPRPMWEDNIKMALRKIRWGVTDWIDLVQNSDQWRALVTRVMNLRVSKNVEILD
jgi:hypothetical protein